MLGGLSGSKDSREKCTRLSLKIVVDDLADPMHVIDLLKKPALKKTGWLKTGGNYKRAARLANHWQGVVAVLMQRAEQSESK